MEVWRLHDVDEALHQAWGSGVALAGLSAGANCWFEASTTDSFLLGKADALADWLGFAPGSYCPHYSSEPERRPNYLAMVGGGVLPDGYTCEDRTAIHFVETRDACRGVSGWRR